MRVRKARRELLHAYALLLPAYNLHNNPTYFSLLIFLPLNGVFSEGKLNMIYTTPHLQNN